MTHQRTVAVVLSVQGTTQQIADQCEQVVADALRAFGHRENVATIVVHTPMDVCDFLPEQERKA